MSSSTTSTTASDPQVGGLTALDRPDGRHLRRDRNRDAVVAAAITFVAEGESQPTAAMIAERSGRSLRSVFRYFADLDDLLVVAVAGFVGENHQHFAFTQPPCGTPLAERIEQWIDFRVDGKAATGRAFVALHSRAGHSDAVAAAVERVRAPVVDSVRELFGPELASATECERPLMLAALHSATLIESWLTLVDIHQMTRDQQRAVFRRLLQGVLGCEHKEMS